MRKQRYFIALAYNGKNYHGWQIQKNAITVQQILNEKLSLKFREPIELTGAGRTDTGVHAFYFVAHFDAVNSGLDDPQLLKPVNDFLPGDISVYRIVKVLPQAHARFDARERTYKYFLTGNKSPFFYGLQYRVAQIPDVEAMNVAAAKLLQVSDFTAFAKLHSNNKTNICNVIKAVWTQENEKLVFTIAADRFLRNMVRAIVGTLLEVGYGRISPKDFENGIMRKDRYFASLTAPAHGLFLYDIDYPESLFMDSKLEKPKNLFE